LLGLREIFADFFLLSLGWLGCILVRNQFKKNVVVCVVSVQAVCLAAFGRGWLYFLDLDWLLFTKQEWISHRLELI